MDHGLIAHLTTLLYQHDCVIIPGFGGFILHSRNTLVDQSRQQALPPCRNIRFNSLLKDDDGLLTSCLAKAGKSDYGQARDRIGSFTKTGWDLLRQGKPWIIEGIGTFTLNSENGLLFEPDPVETFLASSFGLCPVTASPAQAARPAARLVRKPADRKPVIKLKRIPAGALRLAIGTLPVVAFLLWGIISPFQVDLNYGSYAGFLIRHSATVKPVITANANDNTAVQAIPETAFRESSDVSSTSIEEKAMEKPAVIDKTEALPAQGPRYYIIGGAFLNRDNADKFMDALKSRGFNAETAGTTRSGQVRISYGSFPLMEDAAIFLERIRREENPSAWILKY